MWILRIQLLPKTSPPPPKRNHPPRPPAATKPATAEINARVSSDPTIVFQREQRNSCVHFVRLRLLHHYSEFGALHDAQVNLRWVHPQSELPQNIADTICQAQDNLETSIESQHDGRG